ncbi:MAG: transporter [Desulfuromonadales bacterium C00003094]|nr:MAG: transporter [Desulfuromonadales bacterium C00003094]OEU75821.1 MAG: transporter [Desulfuromonadales bacterium C00003107]
MFDDPYFYLMILALLVALSAFFSGSETALLTLDSLRVQYHVAKGRPGARLLESIRKHPDRLLGAILVGNNLVNIAASVFATAFFVRFYGEHGELLTILILTPVILIFAEVCPKTFAARNPERVSFWVVRPIKLTMVLLGPVVWLVTGMARLMNRFSRSETDGETISEDQIRTMISVGEEAGVVGQEKRRMLHGVFELSQIRVRDIMIPRTEVVGMEVATPFAEVLQIAQQASHSRLLVYEQNLDQVVGVIHSKDILNYVHQPGEFSLREQARAPYFVPESQRISGLLQAMRQQRMHLAVVVDEYGGVEGIVTLEDIVEEIVGDIQDEYDADEVLFRELGPDRFLIGGSAALRDVNQKFDLQLSAEHATTLAGFLLHCLGTIPARGESCEAQGAVFIVRRVVDKRIETIELKLPVKPPVEDA